MVSIVTGYQVAMILLLDIQSLLAEVLPSFFLLIMVPAFEPLAQGTAGLIWGLYSVEAKSAGMSRKRPNRSDKWT